jgi:hypothetical protein
VLKVNPVYGGIGMGGAIFVAVVIPDKLENVLI